jgi:magnesium chelatase subunit I
MTKPRTVRELRDSDYRVLSVKEELRKNLIEKLRKGTPPLPGLVGYEETVIPQVENAILSGQDLVLLGERGQAKTRLARSLVSLLDEEIPAIAGCEINDSPFEPICRHCRTKIEEEGDDTEIVWIGRDVRYGEKLATPDITVADLIGEVDPIRVAEGRYLSDELTIHYGLVPRTNRGIFCINELPDLAERIQVGLLNVMEERDVQIRGYKVRLPLDLYVVATANPEDYTNRGRIITPLKDRFGSQVRTHYPKTIDHEISIMEGERTVFPDEIEVTVPDFMKEIVAEMTHLARKSGDISQHSGVSVRVSITNFENLISNALKRAIRLREKQAAPRISDLPAVVASMTGKIEIEALGDTREERIVDKLIQGAVLNIFNRHFRLAEFAEMLARFESGLVVEVSEMMPSDQYVSRTLDLPGMRATVARLGTRDGSVATAVNGPPAAKSSPPVTASAIEFILEGLHLSKKLNKDRSAGKLRYRR